MLAPALKQILERSVVTHRRELRQLYENREKDAYKYVIARVTYELSVENLVAYLEETENQIGDPSLRYAEPINSNFDMPKKHSLEELEDRDHY